MSLPPDDNTADDITNLTVVSGGIRTTIGVMYTVWVDDSEPMLLDVQTEWQGLGQLLSVPIAGGMPALVRHLMGMLGPWEIDMVVFANLKKEEQSDD